MHKTENGLGTIPHKTKSTVFLNPDGYIEMVFIGLQESKEFQGLIDEMNRLLVLHGPMNVLLDGRSGRIRQNATTLLTLSKMETHHNLHNMVVLTNSDLSQPVAIIGLGRGTVPSMASLSLGFRPTYTDNELTARQLATQQGDW